MASFKMMNSWLILAIVLTFGYVNAKSILCYYQRTSYAAPKDLNPSYCTHMVFAFGLIKGNTIVPHQSADKDTYSQLVKMRSQYPRLKIILSLQKDFPPVADASSKVQQAFAENAVKFLRLFEFDGVDFDWEWPRSKERDNYTSLLQIFRNEVTKDAKTTGKSPLIMTAALLGDSGVAKRSYDVPSLNRILDLVTIMTYDFHMYIPSVDTVTGYNSPLHRPKGESMSVSTQLKLYQSLGFDRTKLLMGIPTYGRSWELKDPTKNGLHAPAIGRGLPGPVRHLKGIYTYPDVCIALRSGAKSVFDTAAGVPYLYKNSTWVSYDDVDSIRLKCQYVSDNGLAGVGVWAVHLDDLANICRQGQFPLLSTIRNNLR